MEQNKKLDEQKLTDVGHEYYSQLLAGYTSDNIDDYAYHCAYCMSHDWAAPNPTWEDVEKACKLGALWQQSQDQSKLKKRMEEDFKDLFRKHYENGRNSMKQEMLENAGFAGTFSYAGQEECSGLKYYWADNKCNRVPNEKSSCLTSDYYHFNGVECVADNEGVNYCSETYLAKEGECIDSALGCGAGYKNMGGWCNRVRYTPAEAAAVANDDNTNMVTITFKK
jgi:hypothetical protein